MLHSAAEGGRMDLCLKLVEMGADATATDSVSVIGSIHVMYFDNFYLFVLYAPKHSLLYLS